MHVPHVQWPARLFRPGCDRTCWAALLPSDLPSPSPCAGVHVRQVCLDTHPACRVLVQVVDVNRTSKGTSTGGLYRYG